jgi:RNA polymerase sigma-70 factor (ECF subfamily)
MDGDRFKKEIMPLRPVMLAVAVIIASLPRMQKMIIEMRDIDGYELEEIAVMTGLQTATVTVNLSRARKKVRDCFMLINNYKKEI